MEKVKIDSLQKIQLIKHVQHNEIETISKDDFISVEAPLEIRLNTLKKETWTSISVTMRTPGEDEELAIGFLFNEGIIHYYSDIIHIHKHSENIIEISLKHDFYRKIEDTKRHFITTSSCGICSKTSIDRIEFDSPFLPWSSSAKIHSSIVYKINDFLDESPGNFKKTGSVHSASLTNLKGDFIKAFEDVGRHNALDKLVGYGLKNGLLPFSDNIIVLSGRVSFELVQKSSMTGTSIIIAKGAPTDLAIKEASAQNICIVGFLKKQGFNIYSCPKRILI